MANQSKLTTIPADLQYRLLSILPHFYDLGALILTARCFYDIYKAHSQPLLDAVGKIFLGSLFEEALVLARTQEAAYGLGDASVEGFSGNTVLLVINNDYIARSLEPVVFGLLKANSSTFDIYDPESLARFSDSPFTAEASPTESIRFKGAVYRFWRFCLQPRKGRTKFLQKLPLHELLELSHFVSGISDLIYAMRGVPQESDHDWDYISSVQSTGPENILRLWNACQDGEPEFSYDLDDAGGDEEEGFFDYPFQEVMEKRELDGIARPLKPLFDANNEKVNEVLDVESAKSTEQDPQS
ncbi:hypothetical protein DFH07DRAFT_852677 [Mycena maculata]|uniref:F-box domain-containing protein n=1 Tax=Mycena maculata TaxID=230809 RepID=A0AAD7HT34_9AGAR|nr:hypothetical protein DFH07DRAFT_852677 [Mycena maculata]